LLSRNKFSGNNNINNNTNLWAAERVAWPPPPRFHRLAAAAAWSISAR
jgi:hypothetical protein